KTWPSAGVRGSRRQSTPGTCRRTGGRAAGGTEAPGGWLVMRRGGGATNARRGLSAGSSTRASGSPDGEPLPGRDAVERRADDGVLHLDRLLEGLDGPLPGGGRAARVTRRGEALGAALGDEAAHLQEVAAEMGRRGREGEPGVDVRVGRVE